MINLAFDDTDSRTAGCTTHIAFDMISSRMIVPSNYPSLVRLNPNIPYKTRGNGAICITMDDAEENKTIGYSGGKKIVTGSFKTEPETLLNMAVEEIEKFYIRDDENTNPGIVVSDHFFHASLYHRGLEETLSIEQVEKYLSKEKALYYKFKNGRGLIGASCALSWDKKRVTYEILTYRYPKPEHIDVDLKRLIGRIAESYDSTFNNVDGEDGKVALFPVERTPVIFGIRGTNPEDLLQIVDEIKMINEKVVRDAVIFASNQGTDDHIQMDPDCLIDGQSYSFEGIVTRKPIRWRGGHVHFSMKWKNGEVGIVCFEPSKSFRNYVERLLPGDQVRVYGSYDNGNIKLEKINIIEQATVYKREPPKCRICGKKCENRGGAIYRCSSCRREMLPDYNLVRRDDIRGKFEPPVYARRHLSMPWKLEGRFSQ
ncbi:TiaS agmantine-binding domain-containing protein [Caldiplasma sukawensis]